MKPSDSFSNEPLNSVGEIQHIIWVNPDRLEEQPILWLQNGAPPEAHRPLSA